MVPQEKCFTVRWVFEPGSYCADQGDLELISVVGRVYLHFYFAEQETEAQKGKVFSHGHFPRSGGPKQPCTP